MNASRPPQSGTVETPKVGQPQRVPVILLQKLADKDPARHGTQEICMVLPYEITAE